jgi:hypothetical protein
MCTAASWMISGITSGMDINTTFIGPLLSVYIIIGAIY